MKLERVLIAGGGIGGLVAGIALARKGIEVRVFEAARKLEPVGKGIWVPTNAMQVMERLGVAQRIMDAGWAVERIEVGTVEGVSLMDVDVRRFQAKYGYPTVSIHRAKLVAVLAEALPEGALALGKRVSGFTQDGDGVTARMEDGQEVRGDVLVGADGIRSVVREGIVPGVKMRYSEQTCFRGIARMELSSDWSHRCMEVWGGESRFGFSAIGAGEAYWFAPVKAEAGSPLLEGEALCEELRRRYEGFPGPIPEIVRKTPAEEIIRTDLYDIEPLARWWAGRVVLVGDAAHAMTPNLGQGGAQAVEDGYVLAEQLGGCGSVEEAFGAYERMRGPKARWVARTAWRLGKLAHMRPGITRSLRDLAMKWTPDWMNDRQIDRILRLDY